MAEMNITDKLFAALSSSQGTLELLLQDETLTSAGALKVQLEIDNNQLILNEASDSKQE